ncbi:MAG: twin-arginine translocase TatA/TatE family subunit [Flavobacteriales bacterium]|nr:twin-arginine translocase TatA/TatE family subunit [Flavobacteriales bacterium]|tara:strand:- start:365915 stop:366094 length:180 start_codon:yes stop_codon:yes gene_type:complete
MNSILFIQNIGGGGLAVILVLALLLFGGKKIPELMRGLGKGVSEFKKGKDGEKEEKKDD